MINYRFTKQINPKYHYFNINFDDIKASLIKNNENATDYNSLIVIKRDNYFFTLNELGHITIHFNDITKEEIKSIIQTVDDIFSKFEFVMDYPLDSYLN